MMILLSGQHRIHHIPVKELNFSHLQDLRVNYAKPDVSSEEQHDDALPDLEFKWVTLATYLLNAILHFFVVHAQFFCLFL